MSSAARRQARENGYLCAADLAASLSVAPQASWAAAIEAQAQFCVIVHPTELVISIALADRPMSEFCLTFPAAPANRAINVVFKSLHPWSWRLDEDKTADRLEALRESERHYRMLLDESVDPTFSFFPDGTYRYVNSAFAKGVEKQVHEIIGNRIWDVFEQDEADKRFSIVKRVFAHGKIEEIEVRVPLPSGDTYYLTTVKPIINSDGVVETVICTSKNITKRKLAEIALQEEHNLLLAALDEIKTLSGLLPICASCKKIRDDKGYWKQIESYIQEHSSAKFSHSICPDCFDRLYKDELD